MFMKEGAEHLLTIEREQKSMQFKITGDAG